MDRYPGSQIYPGEHIPEATSMGIKDGASSRSVGVQHRWVVLVATIQMDVDSMGTLQDEISLWGDGTGVSTADVSVLAL